MRSSQPAPGHERPEADGQDAPRWGQARRTRRARLAAAYRALGVVVLTGVLLIGLLEGAARIVARVAPGRLPDDPFGIAHGLGRTSYPALEYYRTKEWGEEYWRELRSIRTAYHPYVVWRRAPFEGRHIAVDQEGIRYTPGAECGGDAYRVFALGGSTMWGYGAPDHATIPAYLQAALDRRSSRPVCVVNLAEPAFNSTQDLIELQRRLARGDVPDLALFLQGSGDLWAAHSTGRPGVHGFLGEIAGKLERPQGRAALARLAGELAFVRLLHPVLSIQEPRWTTSDTTLADSVVTVFLNNYRMLGALARAYDFRYEVFWQPNLHTSAKALTPEEQALKDEDVARTLPAWPRMIALANETLRRRAPGDGRFHDLRNVFDGREELLFIDFTHVVPEGNRILADRIHAELRSR